MGAGTGDRVQLILVPHRILQNVRLGSAGKFHLQMKTVYILIMLFKIKISLCEMLQRNLKKSN